MKMKIIVLLMLCSWLNISTAQEFQDCFNPKQICSKGTYHINSMNGIGKIDESKSNITCHNQLTETNSIWISWKTIKSGILTFTIDPLSKNDDIDFILYKKNGSCDDLTEVRCMASGRTYGDSSRKLNNCSGKTGLSLQSIDQFETSGCKYNDDNYLKFLNVNEEEEFILFINNYTSGNGLSFTIEGDFELEINETCNDSVEEEVFTIKEIYPNPADNSIFINYIVNNELPVTYNIITIGGELISSNKMESSSMGEHHQEIVVKNLPPGTYLIQLSQENYTSVKRFIKQ